MSERVSEYACGCVEVFGCERVRVGVRGCEWVCAWVCAGVSG